MRRWAAAVAILAVLDVLVLVVGYRAHTGTLPPFQRQSSGFRVSDADPTAVPTTAGEEDITGPVLLGVNAAGDVLRATRGACEERFANPARVWTGNVDEDELLTSVEVPVVLEVLGVMVYADGTLRVTGLDSACDKLTLNSDDGGVTWTPVDNPGIWGLVGDTTASTVSGPRGSVVQVPCPATQIVNLPGRRAIANCSASTFFPLVPGEQAGPLNVGTYSQLSVTAGNTAGEYLAFGASDSCAAQVADVTPTDQSLDELECFGAGRAPLAIAAAGDLVVVQIGNDVEASQDGGENFDPVGPVSEATS